MHTLRNLLSNAIIVVAALSLMLIAAASPAAAARRTGAVYVLTNQSTGNTVMVFRRAPNGVLTAESSFSTGGKGMGTGGDPLGSQGALTLAAGNRLLLAVNAGSNEISEFAVQGLNLRLLDKVSSHGLQPVSVAVHDGLVYVLNAGGTPNIAGFLIDPFNNRLVYLPRSATVLADGAAAAPAQVGFSKDGGVLMVTEKGTSKIDTFTVGDLGYAVHQEQIPSSGATPFGFEFTHHGVVVISEAGPNALSSYKVDDVGSVDLLSGSIPNGQKATCWAVVTADGRYAYTANAATATLSSYIVARDGSLSLLNAAAAATVAGSTPTDLALSNDSRFLYVREGGNGTVSGFRVEWDGSLTPVNTVGDVPAGAQGIAAR